MSTIKSSTTTTTAYSVEADTTGALVIQTGATPTTAVTIDSSGRVGIGVTPSIATAKLTTVGGPIQLSPGTTSQDGIRITRATGIAQINGINNDNNAYNAITFATGANEAMRIDTSGNVGIGNTPSGTYKLEVTGGISGTSFTGSGSGITGLSQEVGQCRLVATSSTVLTLIPINGQFIKIAGVIYAIPSAGVTLSNSGLSASTRYYIYATISGGNVTLSASATAYATDTTAGNVGVRIKSGDNAFTLVGMIYTSASSQFVDTATNRQVLSYFNRLDRYLFGTASNYSTTNAALTVVTPIMISSLNWADDGISVWLAGQGGMTGAFALQAAIFDNNTANTYGVKQYIYTTGGSTNYPNLLGGWHQPSEGFHSYYIAIGASSGSGTTSINNCTATGYVRG
jgi:hypothetical protein